ncbi:MAG: atpC [Planctomycetaceae bacterium]|nr:atpC [Planctomycetaceae bacterium]
MVGHKDLRFVLVTPEKTLIDQQVESLRFPLFDGQMGVLPGRAPLVGRMGYGELQFHEASGVRSFFVDGGFVQIKSGVVTVLTNRAIPVAELKRPQAEDQLRQANTRPAHTDLELAAKARDIQRAQQMVALAKRSS